jgi:hypothetical protein
MAQYCAREANDRTIDQLHKTRVQYSLRSLAIEILTIYRLGNLGREEPESYFLRPVHSQ